MQRKRCGTVLAVCFSAIGGFARGDTVIRVRSGSPCTFSGNCGGCGGSWATAFNRLQDAIDCAPLGTQVWVAAGSYGPVILKSGVKVYGGFNATETNAAQSNPRANVTVIDAVEAGRAVSGDGLDSTTVLRGFRITRGVAHAFEGGGGMYLVNSDARIVRCVFENNYTNWFGGAVTVEGGRPAFINCEFLNNGKREGNPPATPAYDPVAGGAVMIWRSDPTFANCLFHHNRASQGGAIFNFCGPAAFLNCSFTGNEATFLDGGAILDSGITVLRNCILWGDAAARTAQEIDYRPDFGVLSVTSSDVQGGWPGAGNLDVDPQFREAAAHDYRLLETSPCRNTGDNGGLPADIGDLDWDGNTTELLPQDLQLGIRKIGLIVDMGAYEVQPPGPGGDPQEN